MKPNNWENIFGFFDDLKSNYFANKFKVRGIQLYHLIFHLFFISIAIKLIINFKKRNSYDLSIIGIYFLYCWTIFISHVGAGFEFERMRHTGHAIHLLFVSLVIKNNFFNFKKFTK